MEKYETREHDVLVVGAGGAGLRAAIEASAQGASVGLVTKSLLGKAHTVMAEGGIAAALGHVDTQDGWETHFQDTMKGGSFLNHWRMAQIHAQEAPDRVRELEQWGALFDRTPDGRILQRAFGGHKWKRLAHVGDRTGLEMIRTLQDRGVHQGLEVYMECTLTKLFVVGGRIAGALGYWRESGRFVVFRAKSIVLATGGIGKSYSITSNSWEYTGDGQALAYEAGAELIDMEFVQFHPTGMVWPPGVQGILVTEGVRGEGGILRNSAGERFMWKYLPENRRHEYAESEDEARRWLEASVAGKQTDARRPPELSTRDNVARAIYTENREGRGTPHGGAFLDISYLPAERVKRKLPSMYHQFLELADVDITKQAMEVGPTTHYMMGGIRVDPDTAASNVPGLYAAGEAAAGLHGANRLGGNSLSDLLVFGRRAGAAAAAYATSITATLHIADDEIEAETRDLLAPFGRSGGESPFEVHRALQVLMQAQVGIFRTASDLEAAVEALAGLNARAARVAVEGSRLFNPGWHLVRDLRNMLMVSEAIARSAALRRESRGAHSRLDYPNLDPASSEFNTCIVREHGAMKLTTLPLAPMPADLKALFEAKSPVAQS
ncbi:MAG: fumarate reductase/succinate dehydrogenase flavoprotein subunit [Candidatus Eisenbacteria bacterium]|uniref:Fumarate reductase/succinate dehydrogenase flavoprotein subunit n=1 Tax=Eiseniibacteriota bacterium TaxID=2212470 RepID=A0A849SH60_UNCEI|nr:fumarate reductase/succinate dehydrogenase flavoprotein subunit [Candidatus Eisenbacteria bacterium]